MKYHIREINPQEIKSLKSIIVASYSSLNDFPSHDEDPNYYQTLNSLEQFLREPLSKIFVAVSKENEVLGGVVYFSDMKAYGSLSTAKKELNSSGIRFLCIDSKFQGNGIGKALTIKCISQAKIDGNNKVILHTTKSMKKALQLYNNMGFIPCKEYDFFQNDLEVFGFYLPLN